MKKTIVSLFLITILFWQNTMPIFACGPAELTPIFEFQNAPEKPWIDFAGGKLGILKETHRQTVLITAYRYLKGGGFTANEQKDLVDIWEAEFNMKEFPDNDIKEAVKSWLKERQKYVKNEEKLPQIYTEREYDGGYNFFPNCTKNAFEVAKATLSDRSSKDEKDILEWIEGQDKVFSNCNEGSEMPKMLDNNSPEWLLKDRDYQMAAALFYGTKYAEARQRFTQIALDSDSPWAETADYLVGRTYIREASLQSDSDNNDDKKDTFFYEQAELQLQKVANGSGKYKDAANKLLNLVKYRLRPQERIRELAQTLSFQNGNDDFRQYVIDFNWLIDNVKNDSLEAERKRLREERLKKNNQNTNSSNNTNKEVAISSTVKPLATSETPSTIYLADNMAKTSTGSMANTVIELENSSNYEDVSFSLKLLPPEILQDEITDWIITFKNDDDKESYQRALEKWRQTPSDLWLMTALVKADKNSPELSRLLKETEKVSREAPVYQTVAYHTARLLIERNKDVEARKLLDELLTSSMEIPISSRNRLMALRMKTSESITDFFKFAVRKPFGFGYEDEAQTIDEIIAERKTYYNPEYDKQPREEFEAEIDKAFAREKQWENRVFYDWTTSSIVNRYFTTQQLIEVWKSEEMPDYWKDSLALVIWTRAFLLNDDRTAISFIPEILRLKPELTQVLTAYKNARTPAERKTAGVFVLLKGKYLTPHFQSGFETEEEELEEFNYFGDDRWWCELYEPSEEYETGYYGEVFKPKFLSPQQLALSKNEYEKMKSYVDGVTFISNHILKLAKTTPADRRLPEALYIVYKANNWVKYGCGNYNMENREKALEILEKNYPRSKWLKKIRDEETENN